MKVFTEKIYIYTRKNQEWLEIGETACCFAQFSCVLRFEEELNIVCIFWRRVRILRVSAFCWLLLGRVVDLLAVGLDNECITTSLWFCTEKPRITTGRILL
jgi:hypothetical protein